MNNIEGFEQFLTTQSAQIPILNFVFNLVLTGVLAYILGLIYIRYGNSISNRTLFSKNILLVAITTMVIITIVKSSLALSLGLVGALSIVRFRAAIKEPEELAYLFMAITIGLGLGADQVTIIIVAFLIIAAAIMLRSIKNKNEINSTSLFITIGSNDTDSIQLQTIIEILKLNSNGVRLKRYDEGKEFIESVFHISFDDIKNLTVIKLELQKLDTAVELNVLDQEGIVL